MKAEEPIEEAEPPLSWAAQTAERLNCTCKAVQAFLRLMNGGLGAFHTLLTLAPTYGSDPVAILLGSSMGLGVIAACLQPGGSLRNTAGRLPAMPPPFLCVFSPRHTEPQSRRRRANG